MQNCCTTILFGTQDGPSDCGRIASRYIRISKINLWLTPVRVFRLTVDWRMRPGRIGQGLNAGLRLSMHDSASDASSFDGDDKMMQN